jgi:hypothetical protein
VGDWTAIAAIAISGVALGLSVLTTWLTLFRRGHVKMTMPSVIAFAPNLGTDGTKIFLRMLLYSTAIRGQVIESLFLRLRHNNQLTRFTTWGCNVESLTRGAGLYVSKEGVVCDHHFLLAKPSGSIDFTPGDYELEICSTVPAKRRPEILQRVKLHLSDAESDQIRNHHKAIWFDLDPEHREYVIHSSNGRNDARELLDLLKRAHF